jgi:hypothetical protein
MAKNVLVLTEIMPDIWNILTTANGDTVPNVENLQTKTVRSRFPIALFDRCRKDVILVWPTLKIIKIQKSHEHIRSIVNKMAVCKLPSLSYLCLHSKTVDSYRCE